MVRCLNDAGLECVRAHICTRSQNQFPYELPYPFATMPLETH